MSELVQVTFKFGTQQYDWAIPTEVVDSLTRYTQAQVETVVVPVEDGGVQQWVTVTRPKYQSVAEMIVERAISTLIEPALEQFPPPTIAQLKQQAEAAAQAVVEASKAVTAQIAQSITAVAEPTAAQ